VNKPRADYHAITTKIPFHTKDFSKISHISNDIKGMLTSNAKVFLGKDVPCCFLSRIESKYAELTLGYNLKNMVHHSSESELIFIHIMLASH
jgi:mechanosensitive ion channel protein 1/2/3